MATRSSAQRKHHSKKQSRRSAVDSVRDPMARIDVKTADDISAVLADWKRYPAPVRPLGSGSSTTRCAAASGGTVIRLGTMNRILRINKETVTVQPGVRIAELAEALAEQGLELPCGSDVADRTVGGVVSAPALEAALPIDGGQLAAHVVNLKVVAPSGRKLEVSQRNGRLLSMLRLSYGLLGVIYEITLRVRPIKGFSVHTRKCDFAAMAALTPKLARINAGVKFWLLPFRDRVYLEMRRAETDAGAGSRLPWRLKEWACYSALPGFARSLAKSIPVRQLRYPLLDRVSDAAQGLAGTIAGSGSNAMEQTGRFRKLELEPSFNHCSWAFPAENFHQVLPAYKYFCREYYQRTGFRCDMPAIGHRLNQDGSSLLSPSFTSPMFTITSLCTEHEDWEDFQLGLDEFSQQHQGVPFFNQTKGASTANAQAAFDTRLPFFKKVRQQLDPENRMLNQFFANYLGQSISV